MSRQMTRALRRCARKRVDSFVRCMPSMTNTRSAHSRSSGVSGLSASWSTPADAVSMPGQSANTCSAVGLRRRLRLQRKRTCFMYGASTGPDSSAFRGRIAERAIEFDRRAHQLLRLRSADRVVLAQLDRRQLVLAVALQALVDFAQALAAPETEQHALVLRADQQDRSVAEVHQVAPLDALVPGARRVRSLAQAVDERPAPTGERGDVGIGRFGRDGLLHLVGSGAKQTLVGPPGPHLTWNQRIMSRLHPAFE